jgi:tetratricopeptide (TPR) repeat protein
VRETAELLTHRLQNDPHDAEAYAALRTIYRESGDFASLTNLVEGWAGFQSEPERASRGYLEAARSSRAGGGDAKRTSALLRKALERDVTLREAAEDLLKLLDEGRDTQGLAEFLDSHLRRLEARGGDPAFMAELYTRLGDLWRVTFKRPEVAAPCYQRALELDPVRAAMSEHADAATQTAADAALSARLYAAEAESEADPALKSEHYVKLANLFVTPLGDLDSAVRALRSALAATPSNVRVMHQLATLLHRRAATRSGEEALRDKRRVAELYYQIAQAVSPEDAIDYLEAALFALPVHEGALHMLEEIAPKLDKQQLLPRHWVNYLAQAEDAPEVDQRRVQLARAYVRAGQIDDAIYCLEQAAHDATAAQLLAELRNQRGLRPGSSPPRAVAVSTTKPPVRQRKQSAERSLDAGSRVTDLRRAIHDAIADRDATRAAEYCRELMLLEPGDTEAFAYLESHFRKTRDPLRLRELLLASTEVAGVSIDTRKQRLREVAALSETKLKDTEGAIEVWRAVVALDPNDAEASQSWKRLLTRTQRWDELAGVLEREALASRNAATKVVLLGQIAAIHRDKRKDLPEAAEALRQLYALLPDAATRDELCELLLTIGNHIEAVPLLRERVQSAADEREKLRLLRLLAETLDEQQGDPEAAYEVCAELLALRPKDAEALSRMERIDERTGNIARLLTTLERRVTLAPRGERPGLFARMAMLAERQLDDVDRAAAYYTRALELEPSDESVLDALCQMFEQRERYQDLVELLKARIANEKEPARRIELERRRARALHEHLRRDEEAAECYRRILLTREDPEALAFLLEFARGRGDAQAVAELSASLARLHEDPLEKRALLLERARVLRDDLDKPREAARTLREIVEHVDPDHDMAIEELSELCERLGDAAGLSVALRRKHARTTDLGARASIAKRLADLCEHELRDAAAAIDALSIWAGDEPTLGEPHRRLVKLLAGTERSAELVASYDALSRLEEAQSARTRAALDAAKLGYSALNDVDGAFERLGPLVEAGDEDAFEALAAIAQEAGRSEALAALCVTAAQRTGDPALSGKNWRAAALVYADCMGVYTQALEAALRMLATDLSDRSYLGMVEDYAVHEKAWVRLAQVYERLLKTARDDAERVELLTRHARLLDERAGDASEAFNRILRACALAPHDEPLLARAEDLAKRADRGEEVLALYDARRHRVTDPAGKLEISLRAARLCDSVLEDRPRANAYLKSALSVAGANARLWERVVHAAEALDHNHTTHGAGAALRALIHAHRELAEKAGPELGPLLILRADGLLRERLRDDRTSFDVLRQGVGLFPQHNEVYEALAERATTLGRLDALDGHLARCIDKALDPQTAATLLARRAALLEGPLGKPQAAIDVLTKLLQLRPDDAHAAARLRRTLRKARRFPDLLLAIHKQLQRAKQTDERLALIKESAIIWESDLRNRFEARDAWRKALELAPTDPEAQAGVTRTEQRLSFPGGPSEPPPAAAFDGDEEPLPPEEPLAAEAEPEAEPAAAESGEVELMSVSVETESENADPVDFDRSRTAAGGWLAPPDASGEETRDIDVEVDMLPSEEIDIAIESPRASAPPRRSAPPPPPRSLLSTPPRHAPAPGTSRPPPPPVPGRKG